MTLKELYRQIGLQQEIVQSLNDLETIFDMRTKRLEEMMDRERAGQAYRELEERLAEDGDHMKMLLCQLECARRVFDRYREKGISGEIFTETMKCFPRFIGESEKMYGRLFFDRGWWTYRQISMSLFRIGALEYELCEKKGEREIGLHIPSDADLSRESVDASLRQAEAFFETYYPVYNDCRYTCDSWLLSPVLEGILPEDSRILAFQKRFRLTGTEPDNNESIRWIFQRPADTEIRELPENTTLQRGAKALLLAGGSIGSGCGTLILSCGNAVDE